MKSDPQSVRKKQLDWRLKELLIDNIQKFCSYKIPNYHLPQLVILAVIYR